MNKVHVRTLSAEDSARIICQISFIKPCGKRATRCISVQTPTMAAPGYYYYCEEHAAASGEFQKYMRALSTETTK